MEYIDLGKSANQIWKESGSTLSFKNWLQREKDKGRFLPNKTLSEFNSVEGQLEPDDINVNNLVKNKLESESKKKDSYFDISKVVVIVAVGLIIGGFALKYYKKK